MSEHNSASSRKRATEGERHADKIRRGRGVGLQARQDPRAPGPGPRRASFRAFAGHFFNAPGFSKACQTPPRHVVSTSAFRRASPFRGGRSRRGRSNGEPARVFDAGSQGPERARSSIRRHGIVQGPARSASRIPRQGPVSQGAVTGSRLTLSERAPGNRKAAQDRPLWSAAARPRPPRNELRGTRSSMSLLPFSPYPCPDSVLRIRQRWPEPSGAACYYFFYDGDAGGPIRIGCINYVTRITRRRTANGLHSEAVYEQAGGEDLPAAFLQPHMLPGGRAVVETCSNPSESS